MICSLQYVDEILAMHGLPPLSQVEVPLLKTDREACRLICLCLFMTMMETEEAIVLTERCIASIPQRPS